MWCCPRATTRRPSLEWVVSKQAKNQRQHRTPRQRQDHRRHSAGGLLLLSCVAGCLSAQELQPRAYIPAPDGLNYFGISYSNNAGGLLFDPSLPVTDAHVNANIVTLAFGQTLGLLGRTVQILMVFPYAVANLNGNLSESGEQYLYRSGLGDATFRYAMNIHGAPAMDVKEFSRYHQKTIVGASITVTAPMSQYDPRRLINIGTNRWAFKPELGVSRALGKWTLEGAAGLWLYTANHQYYGSNSLTQLPLGSLQVHVVRNLPRRSWLAFDGTFYTGARSQINGRDQANYQGNTRFGATFGIALNRRQAIKISYFEGALTRVGTDIRSLGISYNVIWQTGRLKRHEAKTLASVDYTNN